MSLPTTLAGLSGFIIFIVFIVSMTATDIYPDETQNIIIKQNEFKDKVNITLNQTEESSVSNLFWPAKIYGYVTNGLSSLLSFVGMMLAMFLSMFGIAATLPLEFYGMFVILFSSLIVAIAKLLFFSGD